MEKQISGDANIAAVAVLMSEPPRAAMLAALADGISAGVIPSRFRAKMTAFLREKEMTIFFASMAYHFSEHASQALSRGSGAALIALEKRAKLAQP